MDMGSERTLDLYCTALSLKERKKALYENAMKTCSNEVGVETFKMLMKAEELHSGHIRELYERAKSGDSTADACRFRTVDLSGGKELMRKFVAERGKLSSACVDDVAAIETGIELENESIRFFTGQLERAVDSEVRDFLRRMIEEERGHFILLNDLRFFYVDPGHWFMEKSGAPLDGAGAVT